MKIRLSLRAFVPPFACAFAFVLLLGVYLPAFAQSAAPAATTPPSDDVVQLSAFNVTTTIGTYHEDSSSMASKVPMNVKELASSLSIMNSTAITDRNAVTLTDVFNYVVGATQSQGNINGFSFRGFPNTGSYTQNIQFDGLMGATLKKASSSAANVDSLEFLKGPNGVLYGQMNPGGLLNIVTKSPMEGRQTYTYVRATMGFFAGAFDNFGSKTTSTVSVDTTGPALNSQHLFYRLIVDASSSPSSRPGNFDRTYSIYPSLTYRWNQDTYFTVKVESSQNHRRQDDGVIPIFTNNIAYGETARYYTAPLNTVYQDLKDQARDFGSAFSTFFHAALGKDWTLRVQTRAVWHLDVVRELTVNNANVFSPTATFATPTSLLRRQYNYVKNGHRYDFADANIFRTFNWDPVKDIMILGAGGGGEFFGNARLAFGPNLTVAQAITLTNPVLDQTPYPADGTGGTNQVTWQSAVGEYVSNQMKIGERLHVSFGVRHDHQQTHGLDTLKPSTSTFATVISPYTKQAGAVFDINSSLSAYASWSQSIKPQTTIAFDQNGNSTFPPESGEQYEAGLKFESPGKNVNATVATYQITRSNVVVPSGTNFTVPTGGAQVGQAISRLDGEQQSKGIELELQWQPLPNWQIQSGYAYSKATITASIKNPATVGMDLANAPRVSGNIWTRYNIPQGGLKGLGFGTGIIYVGKAWSGDPTTTVYYRLASWTRVDSSVYYKWKHYDFALNVQNLLDRRYISAAQSALTLNIGEQRKLTFSVGTRF